MSYLRRVRRHETHAQSPYCLRCTLVDIQGVEVPLSQSVCETNSEKMVLFMYVLLIMVFLLFFGALYFCYFRGRINVSD